MTTTTTPSVDGSPADTTAGEPDGGEGGSRKARRVEQAPGSTSRWWGRMPRLWVRDSATTPRRRRPLPATWVFVRSALTSLTLLALGFVALLTLGSQLQAGRDQQVLYSQFREQLANAVAPVGPLTVDGTPVEPGSPVAVLSIPQIGVDHVVVEGTTSGDTMAGPGHRRDTVLPGQVGISVLMGRQAAYGAPFSRLSELTPGTTFTVTTGQGVATFRVDGVRRAGDPQPAAPAAGSGRLILTSATGSPFLPDGLVRVDATVVSTTVDGIEKLTTPFPVAGRGLSPAALPDSEKAMGSDTSQLFALVLWIQAFLLGTLAFAWARERWGVWQAWTVGLPVLLATGWAVSTQLAILLPNLI